MRFVLRLFLLLALAIAGIFPFAARNGAHAHAALIGSSPVEGSVAPSALDEIRLRFNEPVKPLVMRLTSVDHGVTVALSASSINNDVAIKTPNHVGRGTHVLSWRVVSSDGHPIGGTISFSIGAPSVSAAHPTTSADRDTLRSALTWLARLGVSIGLFFGVGGAFFSLWIASTSSPNIGVARFIYIALAIGSAAAIAGAGFQGLDALDAPLSSLLLPETWRAGLATAYGPTLIVAFVAFAAAAFSLRMMRRNSVQRALAASGLILVGVALALSGHASSAEPQWLTRPAVFIHGVGIAYWLGALAPLLGMLRAMNAQTAALATLKRFSDIAIPLVALIASAGVALAAIQLQSFSALIGTAYGRVLLVKLALVAALLGLATLNRFYLTPAIASPEPSRRILAHRRMIRSIGSELLLAIAVIAIAALWRFTPPPRALALIAAAPATIHIHAVDAMADIAVTPGRAGPVSITLDILNGEFGPLTPKEVTVFLSNPAAGVEEIERAATRAPDQDGRWQVEGMIAPLPGKWRIRVELLITDFKKITLEDAIDIRP